MRTPEEVEQEGKRMVKQSFSWHCKECGYDNFTFAKKCDKCGTPKHDPNSDESKSEALVKRTAAGAPGKYYWSKKVRHWHGIFAFGFLLFSLWMGATFAMGAGTNAPVLLARWEETMSLLYEDDADEKLEGAVKLLANQSHACDAIKVKLLQSPYDIQRILDLVSSNEYDLEVRNYAAKILDNLTQLPEYHQLCFDRGLHRELVAIIRDDEAPLYVAKVISYALCNLSASPEYHVELGLAGAINVMYRVAQNPFAARQRTRACVRRIAASCSENAAALERFSEGDRKLIIVLAEEDKEARKSILYPIQTTLMETGLFLYAHTIFGGALWGLAYSIRDKVPKTKLVQNVLRTALVTGLIPAYFVGGCVSLFRHFHRQCETRADLFWLYSTTFYVTIQPWFYLLPVLEAFSPLWMGGHIVGFMSFFIYMRVTNSDIIQNDEQLKFKDKGFEALNFTPPEPTEEELARRQYAKNLEEIEQRRRLAFRNRFKLKKNKEGEEATESQ